MLVCILFCLITIYGYANSVSHIVVQNEYFPKRGKEEQVYTLRLQASKVLTRLGVPNGRVLKGMNISDRPYVMWECDYNSLEERQKAAELVSHSDRFKNVEKKMETLINHFERHTWQTTH